MTDGFLVESFIATYLAKQTFNSVMRGLVPGVDNVGARSETDRFQESTYGRTIPTIYGNWNRVSGNVILYGGIGEYQHVIKHTNGTFGSSTYEIWYTYATPFIAVAIGGPISAVNQIIANGKVIWNSSGVTIPDSGLVLHPSGHIFDRIELYNGSYTQPVSPTGATADRPNFGGISYVLLRNLQLDSFGRSIPNLEFVVSGPTSIVSSAQVITDVCTRAGILPSQYSIHPALNNETGYWPQGYVVSSQSTAYDVIKTLAEAFAFDIVETNNVIYFVPKAQTVAAAIDTSEMGAGSGKSSGKPFETVRNGDAELPHEVSVSHIDRERSYEKNTQISQRRQGLSTSKKEKNFQITLYPATAKQIADRLLWEPHAERLRTTITVNRTYDFLVPGNYVSLKVGDFWQPFRLERKTLGANGILELALVSADPAIYDGSIDGGAAPVPSNPVITAGNFDIYTFNAPFTDTGGSDDGVYWVSSCGNDRWVGGSLYRSTDGGDTFSVAGTAQARCVVGTVTEALPGGRQPNLWDRASVITVTLDSSVDELLTVQETSALSGQNMAWVGAQDGSSGEIIIFQTATLITSSPRVYQLSNLIRGVRSTEYAIGGHSTGERFVLLTNQVISSMRFGYGDIGRQWIYKEVGAYQAEPDVVATFSFTNTGERARPRAPIQAKGSRDSSNNLTINWQRRTRLFGPGVGYGPVPLDEAYEAYEIEIYNTAFTLVLRTITSISTTSATYSAADQTADGLTPGDNVNIRIYQMSANVGRGRAGSFTV